MKKIESTNHTFVICAYKESPYLEECIISLVSQSVSTNIAIATSTPCQYISNLAEKYGIELFIRDGKSNIKDDWNFAYDSAKTDWVTIAHQDDKYNPDYVKYILEAIKKYRNPIVCLTDYLPIKNGIVGPRDINSKIRRLLRSPLKVRWLAGCRFWKKLVLSLGNTFCCPSITYNKKRLGKSYFTSNLGFNIDWDTFLKFAYENGEIAYVDRTLTYYRIHDKATSKEFIDNHRREKEDRIMFAKFWPKWIVDIIMLFYVKAYETYND